jgi:secreted Zn-dependent insulinase-like peptidase
VADVGAAAGAVRVWWKQSTWASRRPTAAVQCKIRAPQVAASARHAALADLYAWTVRDRANSELFSARRAGYAYRLSAMDDGFTFHAYGWDSQLQEFIDALSNHLRLDKSASARGGVPPMRPVMPSFAQASATRSPLAT